jgi:hypothetical protein
MTAVPRWQGAEDPLRRYQAGCLFGGCIARAMHPSTEDSHCSFASHRFTVRNLLSFIDYGVLLPY